MKKIIRSLNAHKPIGPYNQAILVNDTLYLSGQIGLDPIFYEIGKRGNKKGDETGNGKSKISPRGCRNEFRSGRKKFNFSVRYAVF